MKKYFDYLEQLRQSGETNMFGAVLYLQREFPELSGDTKQAGKILKEWMSAFGTSQTEGYFSAPEVESFFLFYDFTADLAAHLSTKSDEERCLLCKYNSAEHECGTLPCCLQGIKEFLLEHAIKYRESLDACCKNYFEYLNHLNETGLYDQYEAETALKTEFPYLASHDAYAKYVMASWMLMH